MKTLLTMADLKTVTSIWIKLLEAQVATYSIRFKYSDYIRKYCMILIDESNHSEQW